MMVVDYASSIRRGEQVGIVAMLYNKSPKEILVLLTVSDSPDYVFVHVGKHGQLEYDDDHPRFSTGEHQHLVWVNASRNNQMIQGNINSFHFIMNWIQMPGESEREIRIPIKPIIDQGTVSITITATTQIRSDSETVEIEILVRLFSLAMRLAIWSLFNWCENYSRKGVGLASTLPSFWT